MKRIEKCGLILGAALLFGAVCHGQVLVDPPPSVTISGTVRDPSGAPAAGVEVTFHPGRYPDAPLYAEARTDTNGRYEIILKRPLRDPARPPFWIGPISPTNGILARDLKRNLAAIGEFTVLPTKVDLELQPGITLSGSVKDTKGAPVSTASLNLYILVDHLYSDLGPQPVKVDAQGAFSVPALPQGFEYQCSCGATRYAGGTVWLRAKDSHTSQFAFPDFVLKLVDRKIAGQLLGPDGKPAAGARLGISGAISAATNSDAAGHFAFDVCEGSLSIWANFEYPPGSGKLTQLNFGGPGVQVQGGDTNIVLKFNDTQPRLAQPELR